MLNKDDAPNGFPEKLKAYRLDRYWTLKKMARETGLSLSTIWKIENRKVKASDLTMTKILKLLPDLRTKGAA